MIIAIAQFTISVISDGLGIQSTTIDYAVSSSGVTPPGNIITDGLGNPIMSNDGKPLTDGDWTTTLPTVPQGMYLWTRTRFVLTNGSFDMIYNVSRAGEDGPQGEDAPTPTHIYREFRLSDSSTTITGIGTGYSWSTTQPKIESGQYLWKREVTEYSDGSTLYSNAFCETTLSGVLLDVDRNSKAITQKVWASDITNSINEYDGSTGKAIRDRVTKTETDISGITSQVSDISSELDTKADGSTVTTLQQTVSTNEQTASQFRQTVQSDYAKLTDVDTIINNIKIGGNNLYVIKDEVPGYIHSTSGAISTQSASYKEVTSSFIPVKPGESYILQSWATPTTSGKSWLAYQYYSDNSGTPFGNRVSKYGDTLDSGVEVTADGQEHLTYKISIPNDVSYLRMSYRKYNDGYAMIEKATTPSEYAMNPEDLQNYTDSVVSSAKSEIKQTTDSINLKVSKKVGTDEIISSINASTEGVTIQASKINLLGQVTFEMLNNAAQTRITDVESSAALANDKSNQTLAMKVNYSSFSYANNGECYIHGFNENNEPADVNGYIYWKGRKITVAKTIINPDAICPYFKTIYLVLRLSSTTATSGTLYMVWYNSGWKYAVTPTPSAVGGTWTWNENTDIAIGQFVEPGSDGIMFDAYLYYPPRSPYEIVTSRDNAYGYAKGAVDWTSANGSNMTNALSMIKKWTNNAVSDTTTIQGGWIATNTITSNQLATNAIMSTNYEASTNLESPYSKYGTFLDLSNGNFWTPNFGVINITPTGTEVPTGAWFNGTVYANAGRFGEGSSYWNIETVTDYEVNTHAALVGTGNAYLQTGNWQVNDNAVQTRKYVSTAEYSGQTTYYKDIDTNTYYDVGMKIPTNFSQRTSSDSDVTTYNKSFFYGRKYTGNNLPSLDSEWTYFFQVDSQGNIYECGQPLNARYAAIGDVEGQYVSTTGGTVNGNLTVTGTLTATASNATKVGHSLSINNKSFDGSATVNVGTIGVGYGGTGATSFTAGTVLIGNGSNAIQTRSIRNNTTAGSLGWTNSSTDNTLITTNTLAYWNGRYDSTRSNLEYVKLGKLGTVVTHDIEDFITTAGGTIDGSLSVTELTAGNLIVTGAGTFTNGLYGDLTGDITGGSTKVFDSGNGTATTFAYSKSGLAANWTTTPWFAAWNGYELRAINVANVKTTLGLGSVENTADANKNVLSATKFTSAQSVTLTGDTTGTASSQAGWSITTTTNRLSTIGSIQGDDHAVAIKAYFDANKANVPRNKLINFYSSAYNNGSLAMGYFLACYDNNPYGGFFVSNYNKAYYVGIENGTYTQQKLVTSTNYTDYTVTKTGTGASGTWGISISGSAATWSTGRTLTIGGTGKTVDGSANVSWSKAEISGEASTTANGWMSSADKTKLAGIEAGAQVNTITGVKGNSESTYRTGNVNITAANIGLGNLTNNKQVKGLSSGTTSGHLVAWGTDGYTVADSGISKSNIVKSVASDSDGKLVLTYADNTTSDPITVQFVATEASSVSLAEALNVNGAAVGSATQPVYFDNTGKPTLANKIPKLNGASSDSAFYAPTSGGTSGQYLKSNGNSAPTWASFSKSTVGLGNVDNTADANKNVLTATKFNSTRKIELTGDVTGSATTDGSSGWSIATTVGNDTHNHTMETIVPMATHTYSGIIASADDEAHGIFVYATVRPTTWDVQWHVRYKMRAHVPGQTAYDQYSIVEFFGYRDTLNFNIYNSQGVSICYHNHQIYKLKAAGFNAGYGHALAARLWSSSNPTNSTYARTFDFELFETDNCEVTFLDSMTLYSEIAGTGTTNYNTHYEITYGNGLQETADANDVNYQNREYYPSRKTGAVINRYNLAFTKGNNRLIGVANEDNVVAKTKTYTTESFDPFGEIYYFNRSASRAANTNIGNGELYRQMMMDLRYSFNCGGYDTASTLTAREPLYLVCVPQTDGQVKLNSDPISQTLPTSDDGLVYIYLGTVYEDTNPYRLNLSLHHPVYWYKNGSVRQYTNYANHAITADSATNDADGNSITSTYMKKSGDTATGSITVSKAGEVGLYAYNTTAAHKVGLVAGASGAAGVWDPTNSKWIVYSDINGNVTLNGNANTATTATTASRVSGVAGTTNADRHVWFSDSGAETARNYDDDFKYNPSTNTLTVANVSGTATKANQDGDGNTISSTYAKLSGATFTGAVTGVSFGASSYVSVNTGNSGTSGGLALYSTNPITYGIAVRSTTNQAKHGFVQGDWATYFGMACTTATATTRGWVFQGGTTQVPVASISTAGNAVFNGSVTVGGNATNNSGMRMEFDENMGCTNFVFY